MFIKILSAIECKYVVFTIKHTTTQKDRHMKKNSLSKIIIWTTKSECLKHQREPKPKDGYPSHLTPCTPSGSASGGLSREVETQSKVSRHFTPKSERVGSDLRPPGSGTRTKGFHPSLVRKDRGVSDRNSARPPTPRRPDEVPRPRLRRVTEVVHETETDSRPCGRGGEAGVRA